MSGFFFHHFLISIDLNSFFFLHNFFFNIFTFCWPVCIEVVSWKIANWFWFFFFFKQNSCESEYSIKVVINFFFLEYSSVLSIVNLTVQQTKTAHTCWHGRIYLTALINCDGFLFVILSFIPFCAVVHLNPSFIEKQKINGQ